jgi:phospho-N-acetylmuramoyl-pentapeptide-transferase
MKVPVKKGYGQLIPRRRADLAPRQAGHPTMGGLVIIAAVLLAYFASHLITLPRRRPRPAHPLSCFTGLGVVGFLDDIHQDQQAALARAAQQGQDRRPVDRGGALRPRLAAVPRRAGHRAGLAVHLLPARHRVAAAAVVLVVIWVMLLIAAASNGVNLTDGLDGLAAGACVMIFGAYTLVNIWQYNQSCAYTASAGPKCYEVP